MPIVEQGNVELILIAVTAAAVLLQAAVLLAMYFAVRKASQALLHQIEEFRSSVTPIIDSTRGLLTSIVPKVEQTATDVAEVAHRLRVQAEDAEAAAEQILTKLRQQTTRLDEMLSGLLNAVDRAGNYVADVVNRPVRQVSGLLASIKAIVESLRAPAAKPREAQPARDRN